MLNFRKSSSAPLGDIRSAERWIASLPANDPLTAQSSIVTELHKLAARTARRTPAVLEAVFLVDTHVNALVRNLTTQYVDHASRSAKIEDQLWQVLHAFSHGFIECYAAFAREISDPVPRSKWQAVLPLLIARQIVHLGRDSRLKLYRSESWSAAKWTELFTPFTRACALRIERDPLRLDAMGGPTTIECQFLMILVLKLADPGNLSPRQIEWVDRRLEEWCEPLRLTLKPSSATSFYVDMGGSTGLQRRSLAPLEGRVLFVDLQPLHALMRRNRVVLEETVRNEPRTSKKSVHRQQLDLFVKLESRIDPEFRPLPRHGERTPASGSVDAVVGFANITAFVRSDMAMSKLQTNSDRNFSNTMELAVFGRSRAEAELRHEFGSGRISAFASPGGPWELRDISSSGFRLLAPIKDAADLTLNMLVAIRLRGEDDWAMGIIRRMRRLSARDAEIGLQLIANTIASAELSEQRKARDTDYSINGQHSSLAGRQFHGIYLSFTRRPSEPPVQSLIVPAVEFHASRRYTLRASTATCSIRHGRLLEQHADWVWTVIDLVAPESDAAGAGTAG